MYKTAWFYIASSVNKLNVPFHSSWKSVINVPPGDCQEALPWPLTSAAPVSAGGKWMQQKNFLVLRACLWSDLKQPTPHLSSCDPRGLPASWDLPEHRVLWTFPCSHSNVFVRGCRECAKQWEYPAQETQQLSRHLQCRIKELRLTHSKAVCKSKLSYSGTEKSHHRAMALKERRGSIAYEGISILTYS